jgi:hypothetical protein
LLPNRCRTVAEPLPGRRQHCMTMQCKHAAEPLPDMLHNRAAPSTTRPDHAPRTCFLPRAYSMKGIVILILLVLAAWVVYARWNGHSLWTADPPSTEVDALAASIARLQEERIE